MAVWQMPRSPPPSLRAITWFDTKSLLFISARQRGVPSFMLDALNFGSVDPEAEFPPRTILYLFPVLTAIPTLVSSILKFSTLRPSMFSLDHRSPILRATGRLLPSPQRNNRGAAAISSRNPSRKPSETLSTLCLTDHEA